MIPRAIPIAILSEVQDFEDPADCRETVGALPFDMGELESALCDKSPSGQHEYRSTDEHERCIHCGKSDAGDES